MSLYPQVGFPAKKIFHLYSNTFKTKDFCALHYWPNDIVTQISRKNILLIHGYLDHSGFWGPVVDSALQKGYSVWALDLPGHGLSEGEPGDIKDFNDYGDALNSAVDYIQNYSKKQFLKNTLSNNHDSSKNAPSFFPQLVCHSTGCSAVYNWILQQQITRSKTNTVKDLKLDASLPSPDFSGPSQIDIVMIAPLLRCTQWTLVSNTSRFASALFSSVPVFQRATTTNPVFNKARKADSLRVKKIPTQWVRSLVLWNQKLTTSASDTLNDPLIINNRFHITVLQGTRDHVVDRKWNLSYLASHVKSYREILVPNGGHHLHRESEPMGTQVRETIFNSLRKGTEGAKLAK